MRIEDIPSIKRREVTEANGYVWVKRDKGRGKSGASCFHVDAVALLAAAKAYGISVIHVGYGGFCFFLPKQPSKAERLAAEEDRKRRLAEIMGPEP